MSAIRVLAVEDEPLHQENLRVTLDQLGYDLVALESSPEEALAKVRSLRPDIALLDIELGGQTDGIKLAREINEQSPTPIIFVTAFDDPAYIQRARQVLPLAYLVKPVNPGTLQASIELAFQTFAGMPPVPWKENLRIRDAFFVKSGDKLIRIDATDIQFVEVIGNRHCLIVTPDCRAHVRATLAELERELDPRRFIRVHRSFMINLDHLGAIQEADSQLFIGDHLVPLGNSYKESLYRKLKRL